MTAEQKKERQRVFEASSTPSITARKIKNSKASAPVEATKEPEAGKSAAKESSRQS